jgi:hypothetical protein
LTLGPRASVGYPSDGGTLQVPPGSTHTKPGRPPFIFKDLCSLDRQQVDAVPDRCLISGSKIGTLHPAVDPEFPVT